MQPSPTKSRFIPSLRQLQKAAEMLGPADDADGEQETIKLKIGSSEREFSFRRIKISFPEGSEYRWIYEGRIMF